MNRELMDQALTAVQAGLGNPPPVLGGMILGSGWGEAVRDFEETAVMDYTAIPGLGRTGVEGHQGRLVLARVGDASLLVFQGRRHFYEGEGWDPIALPVYLLKSMGARFLLLTNAAGGIRSDLAPGDLMTITDHISAMGANPLSGPHDPFWGPRFPDQSAVYDPDCRGWLATALQQAGCALHEGVYLAGPGPFYETPAEIRAYQALGADAVGMSTVPEAQLAHAAGLRVAALSCISNKAAGLSEAPLAHQEVTETTESVLPVMRKVLAGYWERIRDEG